MTQPNMTSSTDRVNPSLATFFKNGLTSVPPADRNTDQCAICYSDYKDNDDVVSLDPCKHIFHRYCIVTWFRSQVFETEVDNNNKYGTCPLDRVKLFHFTQLEVEENPQEILACFWVQSLYSLIGTALEETGRNALARVEASDRITFDLAQRIIREMIQQNAEYQRTVATHGMLPHSIQTRFATTRHQVDVRTEEDQQFINSTLRGDVMSLRIIASQQIDDVTDDLDEELDDPNNVDLVAMIEPTLNGWTSSNYPRTNYITMDSLHRLVICAYILVEVSGREFYHNSQSFLRLLTHGEALLIEAQERATNGSLSEAEQLEHYRVLDWVPTEELQESEDPSTVDIPYVNSRSNLTWYSQNFSRVHWIVWLRQRTRGQDADPLGP